MAVSNVNNKPFDFWSMGLASAASAQDIDDDSEYRYVPAGNHGAVQGPAVVQQATAMQHQQTVHELRDKQHRAWDHYTGAATTKVALEGSSERVPVSGDAQLTEEAKAQQLASPKKG